MKKLYIVALCVFPTILLAQKRVDLDRYKFSVQYRSLPYTKIDSTYRTYNVNVESTKLMQPFLADMSPENTVLLDGWRKLSHQGHIEIQIKLEDLLPETVTVKQKTIPVKNIKGQVTGNKTTYWQEVVYTFAATAQVADYKGMHIIDIPLASRSYKQTYNSPEFSLRPVAEGYFLVNSFAVTKNLIQKSVTKAMHYLNDRINYNFGYNEVRATDYMWIIDSKKHPEYAAYRKAFVQMNDVLFSMNANSPTINTKEQLQPVIDYFEKIKTKYTSRKKHDRKIRYASYYNLAVLYYYLDDPQSMMKEASGLVLNDFASKDGKSFETTAIRLKNLFQQNNIYTRHFDINTSVFKGPNEKADVSVNGL